MRTKLVYTTVVVVAIIATVSINYSSNKTFITDVALNNIEAMADNQEGGINHDRCGKNLLPTQSSSFHYKCNSNTNKDTMYPCPSSTERGEINEFEGNLRCYQLN